MSWDDYARRRAAIRSVLAHASQHPGQGVGYDAVPEARAAFRSARELVLALQYDWTQALWARIELVSLDRRRAHLGSAQIAAIAWAETAQRNPVLRRLLDAHRADLGAATRRQEDLLVTTGLGLHADRPTRVRALATV